MQAIRAQELANEFLKNCNSEIVILEPNQIPNTQQGLELLGDSNAWKELSYRFITQLQDHTMMELSLNRLRIKSCYRVRAFLEYDDCIQSLLTAANENESTDISIFHLNMLLIESNLSSGRLSEAMEKLNALEIDQNTNSSDIIDLILC